HLPVKAEASRQPHLQGRAVVIADAQGSPRRTVLDASPQATGVSPGMPLAEAISLCPQATLVEPDPLFYRRTFDGVLDTVETLGTDVDESAPGLAYIGLTGLDRLHGGRARLIEALLHAVPEHLAPRLGVGGSKFASYVAAGIAAPGASHEIASDLRTAFAPLPVDVLPVPWETALRLREFGFSSLGQIAALPAGPLQAQFGRTGKLIWELANGIDPRPLVPRRHEQHVEEWLSFPVPTATIGAITTATEGLLARAFAQPAMRGRFARTCILEATVFRAPPWHKRMVFTQPVGDPHKAAGLVKHTLEGHPPPGPLEELRLTLSGLTGDAGRQESLFNEVRRQENLKEALRQLRARLGMQPPLFQVREVEPWSRLPERRQALVPYAP
ncbi:MAG: DNA polymerase Y family protein, partial [Dehalococcoidia bacterium]